MTNIDCRVAILRNGIEIGELNCIDVEVRYDSKAKVKRGCQITCNSKENMKSYSEKVYDFLFAGDDTFPGDDTYTVKNEYEDKPFVFNKVSDRLQVFLVKDGLEESLGIFMIISSPKKDTGLLETYNFECYDESMKLDQNQIEDRLFIPVGTSYLSEIKRLLVNKGFTLIISDDSSSLFLSDREWEAGSDILDIINELLVEINFSEFHINSNGYAMLLKKQTKYTSDFIYKLGENSVIEPGTNEEFDIYSIPNIFVGVVSNPDVPLMRYKVVNDRLDSSISTVNRGYELTKYYKLNNIASQIELEEFIKNVFNDSLQKTEKISFNSEQQAGHEYECTVQIDTNSIKGLFVETEWTIKLGVKGNMTHVAERKVFI